MRMFLIVGAAVVVGIVLGYAAMSAFNAPGPAPSMMRK